MTALGLGDTLMDSWTVGEVYDSLTDRDHPLNVDAIISAATGPAVRIGDRELTPEQAHQLIGVLTRAIAQCATVRSIAEDAA